MKQEHNQERVSMEKATERPWGINLAHGVPTIFSQSKTGYPAICMMSSGAEKPNNEANAALIVRAVNSHEALIEALENLIKRTERLDKRLLNGNEIECELGEITRAKKALSLAKGA